MAEDRKGCMLHLQIARLGAAIDLLGFDILKSVADSLSIYLQYVGADGWKFWFLKLSHTCCDL